MFREPFHQKKKEKCPRRKWSRDLYSARRTHLPFVLFILFLPPAQIRQIRFGYRTRVRDYTDDHTLLIYLLAQTGNRPWKHTFPRFRSLPYVPVFRNASLGYVVQPPVYILYSPPADQPVSRVNIPWNKFSNASRSRRILFYS